MKDEKMMQRIMRGELEFGSSNRQNEGVKDYFL